MALAALLGLGGCGGGSGAPNNPYAPGPSVPSSLVVLPSAATVYPGTPSTLTAAGGTPPYFAFSSNQAVLPVASSATGSQVLLVANPVDADVTLGITVADSGGQSVPVTVLVRPAPLFSGLTVLASSNECGSANICSGATGTASVTAKGVAGAAQAGRQIRFDVVYGPYAIQTTSPAGPLAQTLTVVTDVNGVARVGIQAVVDSPTQPAQVRATDLTSGQQVTGNFTVVNNTSTTAITVIPPKATIKGVYKNECSNGFQIDYFVYGGNPPYRVTSTFPSAVSLFPSTVAASGGRFSATTNGTCVEPLVFSIVDAAGKQTTAELENLPGTADRPADPPPALAVSPANSSVACGLTAGKTINILITGGTPPYSAALVSPAASTGATPPVAVTPQPLSAPGFVAITGLTSPASGSTVYNFRVVDAASSVASFNVTCVP
jgi:hypothetical protein